ncbi:MAG TPA: hypothetical protein VEZ48_10760 [Sphingomonadaceae bacterium]|nr:hypothetical protein [Sphingomonadaceae bacterium]
MTHPAQDPARARFFALSTVRFAGVGLVMLGMAIWLGDLLRPGGWPAVGAPLFLAGVAATLLLPKSLARRWRTPDPE